ncbi:hypothetical protein E2C01_024804 [Portunus trituberculatus]|uniref:Uncharacterized protein n=1 Tax=Portunus trituberculatus TaxID=210409 RepID=A0A5B7EBJ3_PORTR|nr:hypothetical protein [Portunus trituberculatus]
MLHIPVTCLALPCHSFPRQYTSPLTPAGGRGHPTYTCTSLVYHTFTAKTLSAPPSPPLSTSPPRRPLLPALCSFTFR